MVKYRGGYFNSVSSKQLKKQGIKNNYPNLGTKFWGTSSNNNYGFGNSNIHKNVENRIKQLQPQGTISGLHPKTNVNNVDYSLYGDGFSKEFIDEMLMDQRFKHILDNRIRSNEGEYVNHPNDRGGETKFGISHRWYPEEDIKNLTRERADMILFRDYWKNTNIYQLPDELADIVLDDSVIQGQPTAIKNLQRALGVADDGIIGSNTLNALKNTDYKILKEKFIENVKKVEEQYLNNDSSQHVFEKGHMNRFNRY